MFSKIKHLKNLRSQAKQMQNALSEEKVTRERGGIRLTMDGNQAIVELTITDEALLSPANKEKLEKALKEILTDTSSEAKRLMAKKVQEMGGLSSLGL